MHACGRVPLGPPSAEWDTLTLPAIGNRATNPHPLRTILVTDDAGRLGTEGFPEGDAGTAARTVTTP
jgi:hypothetical protein